MKEKKKLRTRCLEHSSRLFRKENFMFNKSLSLHDFLLPYTHPWRKKRSSWVRAAYSRFSPANLLGISSGAKTVLVLLQCRAPSSSKSWHAKRQQQRRDTRALAACHFSVILRVRPSLCKLSSLFFFYCSSFLYSAAILELFDFDANV